MSLARVLKFSQRTIFFVLLDSSGEVHTSRKRKNYVSSPNYTLLCVGRQTFVWSGSHSARENHSRAGLIELGSVYPSSVERTPTQREYHTNMRLCFLTAPVCWPFCLSAMPWILSRGLLVLNFPRRRSYSCLERELPTCFSKSPHYFLLRFLFCEIASKLPGKTFPPPPRNHL